MSVSAIAAISLQCIEAVFLCGICDLVASVCLEEGFDRVREGARGNDLVVSGIVCSGFIFTVGVAAQRFDSESCGN